MAGKLFFAGTDTPIDGPSLWVSDGTAAGTSELLGVTGAGPNGLNPSNMVSFGGNLYFNGTDSSSLPTLWVSDGTVAGTTELTITGASPTNFNPTLLTTVGNKLYFNGYDASGNNQIWVSDGTAAGTTELTPADAPAGGLYANQLLAFGEKLYFEANDAAAKYDLWVSDGTNAGTVPLAVAGTSAGDGLYPWYLSVFAGKLYFQGEDPTNTWGLWTSDGTAAGTTELSIAGASINGLSPRFMTAVGSKLFFNGDDATNHFGLWVSDGTAAGTTELTVTDASANGLYPQNMVAFHGKLYFTGADTNGHNSLFVSDGTNAGTTELVITGADSAGLNPASLTVFDGKLYFSGRATDENNYLWVSDGTAAGTQMVVPTSEIGTNLNPSNLLAANPPVPVATNLTLAPASDSGTLGDHITTVTTPIITGSGVPGDTIKLYDGTTLVGTATVAENGTWAATSSTLATGLHNLTATQTDTDGNTSDASSVLALRIDTLSAALVTNPHNGNGIVYKDLLNGAASPNVTVTVRDNGQVIGTATSDTTGAWSFDLAALGAGDHTLTASVTDTNGNVSTTPAIPLNIDASILPDTRFSLTSQAVSGAFFGSDYTGPAGGHLQAQYGYEGNDNVFVVANVANVFIYGGTGGQDVLMAKAGSNVLDGRSGTNWMVGATGEDGGSDTFFVDNHTGQVAWSTLLNFHVGDMATLWGFDPTAGTSQFSEAMGATGYQGTTLQATLGDGSGGTDMVTFAGLTAATAQFATTTGTAGGVNYLAVTRIS